MKYMGKRLAAWLAALVIALCGSGLAACAETQVVAHTVTYLAAEGGSIAGESVQHVQSGGDGTQVMALADEGYAFVGWDDGSEEPVRRETGVTQDITLTAQFVSAHEVMFVCDAAMGTLSGEMRQVLGDGEWSSEVTATANLGYRFLRWSNGTLSPTIRVQADKSEVIFAVFQMDVLSLPVLSIDTQDGADILSKEEYVGCDVSVFHTAAEHTFYKAEAKIRGRGNTTWQMPKKPYKLKFEEKTDLFGNGKAKTWTLIANYADQSLLRNSLAYAIAGVFSALSSTTTAQFVDLYLNGAYQGVYLVCEQVEVGDGRVEIADDLDSVDTGYLLEMDNRAPDEGEEGIDYFYADGIEIPIAIKDPDTEDEEFTPEHVAFIRSYVSDAYAACLSGDYARVQEYLYVASFASSYLVHELFHAVDIGNSSFYLNKDAGGKLVCGPVWDFDVSAGNCDYVDAVRDPETLYAASGNCWYHALLQYEEFRALVADLLSEYEAEISAQIASVTAQAFAAADAMERNFQKWPVLGVGVWPNPDEIAAIGTWRGHVEYVVDWLDRSLQYLGTVYPV